MTTQVAQVDAERIQAVRTALRGCQFEKAYWIVDQEHRKDRDCPTWKSYRGRLLSVLKRDFKHGLELCQQAAAEEGFNGQLHANLAWVYFLAGEPQLARESLAEALKWDERNGDALELRARLARKAREDKAGSPAASRRVSGAASAQTGAGAMGFLRKALPTFFGRS